MERSDCYRRPDRGKESTLELISRVDMLLPFISFPRLKSNKKEIQVHTNNVLLKIDSFSILLSNSRYYALTTP